MDISATQFIVNVLVGLLSSVVPAIVIAVASDRTKKAINKRDEEKEELQRYRQKETFKEQNKYMEAVIDAKLKPLAEDLEEIKSDHVDVKESIDLIKKGSRASLRNDLLAAYYSCKKRGYKTFEEAQNFDRMYNAYVALGGNSFIKDTIKPEFDNIKLRTEDIKKNLHEGE